MSWNSGAGPLELRAGDFRQTGPNDDTRDVSQRIYRSDRTYYDQFGGAFEYHPEHNHFHFEDYALVTLRPVNAPGASDRQSAKTTFCVMNSTWLNLSLPRARSRRCTPHAVPVTRACRWDGEIGTVLLSLVSRST